MQRYTDEQYFEVCKLCISYLYDNYYNESGSIYDNKLKINFILTLHNTIMYIKAYFVQMFPRQKFDYY